MEQAPWSEDSAWAEVSFSTSSSNNHESNSVLHIAGPTKFDDDLIVRGSPLDFGIRNFSCHNRKIVENSNSLSQHFENLKRRQPITFIEILALVGIVMFGVNQFTWKENVLGLIWYIQ